jgi:hypothetical protein
MIVEFVFQTTLEMSTEQLLEMSKQCAAARVQGSPLREELRRWKISERYFAHEKCYIPRHLGGDYSLEGDDKKRWICEIL